MYEVFAVFKAIDEVSDVAAGIGRNMDTLSAKFTKIGTDLIITGGQLTAGLTVPILGAASAIVKMGTDFEATMTVVQTMTGSSAEQFDLYREKIEELTRVLPFSANELAQALYFVASAGFRGQEAIDVLTESGKAAAASLTDVETVARSVTAVLNAYGLSGTEAGRITDILTTAVIEGTAEFGDLATSIGRVLPIASQAGVSFEEMMASLATMTRAGLSAEEASTALRQALMNLFAPSRQAQKALDELGLSAEAVRASIREKGLLATLADLMERTGGNVETLDRLIPNVRGLVGVLATAGAQADTYREILDKVSNSMGTTDEAFRITAETARAQSILFTNALQGIGLTIADLLLPPFTSLLERAREWLYRIQEVDPATLELAVKIAGLAAAIGPLLVVLGTLVTAIGALLSPIGLVVVAIVALAAAWATNWGGIRDFLEPIITQIVALLGQVWTWLAENVPAAINTLRTWWDETWPKIQDTVETVWEAIQDVIQTVLGIVSPFIQNQLNMIKTWFDENWGLIESTVRKVWEAIQTVTSTVLDTVKGLISAGLTAIRDWWKEHGDQVTSIVQTVWNLVQLTISTVLYTVLGVIRTVLLLINGDWEEAWNEIKRIALTVWNALQTAAEPAFTAIKTAISSAWEAVRSATITVWDEIRAKVESKLNEVANFIRNFDMASVGRAIISGLVSGVQNAVGNLVSAVENAVGNAIDAAKRLLGIHSPSEVFKTIGLEMMAGLTQGISAHEIEVINAIIQVFRNIDTTAAEQAKDVATSIERLMSAVASIINSLKQLAEYTGAGEYTMWGQYFIAGMLALEKDIPVVVEAMQRIAGAIDTSVLPAMVDLASNLGSIFTSLGQVFEPLEKLAEYTGAGEYTMWGQYFIAGMLALEKDIPTVVEAMQRIADEVSIAETLVDEVEQIGMLFKKLVDILKQLGELGKVKFEEISAAVEKTLTTILQLPQVLMDMEAAFVQMMPMATNILDMAQMVWSAISQALAILAAERIGGETGMLMEFVHILQEVIALVQDKFLELYRWINEKFRSMLGAISLYSEGLAIGISLAQGLQSAMPAVLSAAMALANAVQTAISDALQIASPSRVMMRLGQQAAEGFALGWTSAMGVPAFALAVAGPAARPAMAMPATGSGPVVKYETHIHVGTLVADEAGLRELERRLRPIRELEDERRGQL